MRISDWSSDVCSSDLAFTRLPAAARALTLDGLSGLIDTVAAEAVETHRFLRFQWYAAALAAYGGAARTIVVEREGDPVIALPMIATGPRWLGMARVPGSSWPFRGFPQHGRAACRERVGQYVLITGVAG